jgi:general secretion pathway protein K
LSVQFESGARPRRGFALIAALWLLVAFTVVGATISSHARSRRLGVANSLDEERGRVAAEAGLEHLRSRLARLMADNSRSPRQLAEVDDPWRAAGLILTDTNRVGDQRYHVSIRDAGAALNLNRATEEQLERLLIALPIDAGRATEIAQSVMDWRDSDDLHRLHGAEGDAYLRAGSAVLPANANFSRLEELQYVNGITPEIFARLRPLLTVMGSGAINMNAAPRPVLLSLPGMTEQAVAVLQRKRGTSEPIRSLEDLSPQLSAGARASLLAAMPKLQPLDMVPLVCFETWELHVRSEGWTVGSPVHKSIDAIVVRSPRLGVHVFRQAS